MLWIALKVRTQEYCYRAKQRELDILLCQRGGRCEREKYICFASTSQATARRSCKSASHNSIRACLLNHLLQTKRQYTMQPLYSSPPASLAVSITLRVITGLLALVTCDSSSSHGMTCSIWYFRRRATFVTSAGGMADWSASLRVEGRTIDQKWSALIRRKAIDYLRLRISSL